MEDARSLVDYIAIGIIAFVLLGMVALLFRTLTLVVGFLSLDMADTLERWRNRKQPRPAEDGSALGANPRAGSPRAEQQHQ